MKVYVRRWKAEQRQYREEGPYEIGQYEGLAFVGREEAERSVVCVQVKGRVQNVFMYAGEPNALCVYVEDETETKGDDE